jgi:glycosyltransferase involved in cell wall biosynthesis
MKKACGTPFYDLSSLRAELRVFARALLWRPHIIHVMHLEENYGWLRHARRLTGAKVVATAHQPVAWLEAKMSAPWTLARLDAVLAMARAQMPYFEKHCPGKVMFTPHGVDAEYFRPRAGVKTETDRHVVFCGVWLRDVAALQQAVQVTLGRSNPGVIWDIVGPDWAKNRVANLLDNPAVRWHSNLSDEALRALYQAADVAFLPLLDCAANNAILECMACGVPVVTTRVGGIPDYVPDRCGAVLASGDHAGLVNALTTLLADQGARETAGRNARLQAEALNWPNVAAMTEDIYRRVGGTGEG